MKNTELLKEASRLYKLGFAIHWLHQKSKRPIESGWTTGPRKDWEYLSLTYKENLNVGVRLGTPSQIENKYLAVVDVDVKSLDPRHKTEAVLALRSILGEALKDCAVVSSGRGNGSGHYYCLTERPFKTFNPAQSEEIIKVHMPSKKPSKEEIEKLTPTEIAQGLRLSHAWEISLYSDGRQVVLPPSIHPDSGKPYQWKKHLTDVSRLPVLNFETLREDKNGQQRNDLGSERRDTAPSSSSSEFEICDIDLAWLNIPSDLRESIISGKNINDRSSALFSVCRGLLSEGLDKNEILTVLTDPATFLGACAYDHAKTKNRKRAAEWLWKYTLKKVIDDRNAENVFRAAVEYDFTKPLNDEEVEEQNKELVEEGVIDWKDSLERTPKDKGHKLKNTMMNIKLVLVNTFGGDCFKLNEFAHTEEIWGAFDWLDKRGREVLDLDIKLIKDWFAKTWGLEPSDDKIITAISVIGHNNRYHPVKHWIETLPKWDEVDRIDNFLQTYIPCDGFSELRSVVGRRFLVALIKRIYEPGCQSDYILILEGLQGIKKSSAFRALIGDEWFSDANFNVEDKDAVMVIFSKWLIEFGELSTLDRTTLEHTKAFITRRLDRIRAPFDRKARDYPRQCLFVGSTNKGEYLRDDENRRYWPFRVQGECDIEAITKDRAQLFAEAKYYYDIGEITYLKEEHLKAMMKSQQESREMHDVLIEQINAIIKTHNEQNDTVLNGFEIKYLFDNGKLTNVKNDPYGTARVGTVLRKLGYEQRREGIGERRRLWWRIETEKCAENLGNLENNSRPAVRPASSTLENLDFV